MHANFGSRLDHLSNAICQMNTRIGHIAHHQPCLSSFAPSPSPDESDNASGSPIDDEMTISQ